MNNNILIGVPTRGRISVGTVRFLNAQKHDIYFATSEISVVAARLNILHHFLKGTWSHLFFIDDDIWVEKDAIQRLLQHDKDMVSIRCRLMRDGKMEENIYNEFEERYVSDDRILQKIAFTGLGACLISRLVIRRVIHMDMFELKYKDGEVVRGEDFSFCDRVKSAGFDIYCDTSIKSDHYKTVSLNRVWELMTS